MAKPLSVEVIACASSSKSPHCYAQRPPEPSYRPRQRSYRPSKPSSAAAAPSSGLLSLLATIASASTVYGSPAPPSFLCPSIASADDSEPTLRKRASSPHLPPTAASRSEATRLRPARHVPAKFERGSDGVWRRVESYTLYGSTVASSCTSQDCRQPTNSVTAVDDQIQVTGGLTTNGTTTPSYDISDQLPPGWKPMTAPYEGRTTLILTISLVLAFFICFFIIGCLFWRKSHKKKLKYYDVEAKARRRRRREPTEEEVREVETEKEMKFKQRVWARATARWKANVRHSARQRRGKRLSTRMPQAQQSSVSVDNSRSRLAGSTSSSIHSRNSSRRSSIASIPDQLLADESLQEMASNSPQEQPSTPEIPLAATAISPPAYQHRGQIPPVIITSDDSSVVSGHSTPRLDRSRRPSHSSMYAPSSLTQSQNGEILPPVPLHAAHVATDDKALLARLADLASAPADDNGDSMESSAPHISVPVWQDEEIEHLEPQLSIGHKSDAPSSSLSPLFPPPPSKERLVAAELFEYSFAYDDLDSTEPEPEPSAPPFEEHSCAPLDNSLLLVPSAPPILEEEEVMETASDMQQPSAPDWDSTQQSLEEHLSGQDHDQVPLNDVGLTGPSSSASISQAPVSSVAEEPERPSSSGRTNGIILPGYQP